MTPRTAPAQHDPEKCRMTYVSWMWLAGIMAASAVGAFALAQKSVERIMAVEYEVEGQKNATTWHDTRIKRLEFIAADLDSIKAWTRPKR